MLPAGSRGQTGIESAGELVRDTGVYFTARHKSFLAVTGSARKDLKMMRHSIDQNLEPDFVPPMLATRGSAVGVRIKVGRLPLAGDQARRQGAAVLQAWQRF